MTTLNDDAQWDGRRFRFWIGPVEHGGRDMLQRAGRTRNNGGARFSFCEEDFSWSCIVRREVTATEARAFARGTVSGRDSRKMRVGGSE